MSAFALMLGHKASTPAGFVFNQTISSNTTDYNLSTAALAAGWNGTDLLTATVTVATGVYVYASSTANYGFNVPATIPAGSALSLIISAGAYILGRGGASGTDLNGGTAILARQSLSITNNGTVAGGGGAGAAANMTGYGFGGGKAGGGGGAPNGSPSTVQGLAYQFAVGQDALLAAAGNGGTNPLSTASGGNGGGYGQNGNSAQQNNCPYALISPNAYGTAGKYLDGSAYVTWIATGTRLGGVS